MALESEVKFSVNNAVKLRLTLEAQGASLHRERNFEDNILFDDAEGKLVSRDMVLRLRRCGNRVTVTVKSHPRVEEGMKLREELEVSVNDFDEMLNILQSLGYQPSFRYQKYRTEWIFDELTLCLDETPIGTFLEIEGPSEQVYAAAGRLGLDTRTAVTLSYVALFRLTQKTGDMIFA
ncbi:MAG TPA: class IV adenylate cyclase [Thermoanaerobaculia bacterium]|nr:class IV adenylate cyclase [Thermoanaerobaculia bacterium]HXK69117.1 class IV adenylate cyclase [Thermoanaerobaculia bacterium]